MARNIETNKQEGNRIHIMMACDKNYAPYYGVMLTSLFYNNKDSVFHIHWITDKFVPQKEKDKFQKLIEQYQSLLSIYEIDNDSLTDFPQTGHINYAAYYNLKISEILPNNVHRVIYMDGDMIVNGNIRTLWDIDLKDNACAMVLAPMWNDDYEFKRLGYDKKYGYYNNGTTLYNLEYLRKIDFSKKAIEYIAQNKEHLDMMDQDATNALLHDKIYRLPLIYNLQVKLLWKSHWSTYDDKFKLLLLKEAQHPVIVHYSASSKPWHFSYYGKPYRKLWNKYYQLSPWQGIKIRKPMVKYIKNLLKRILKPSAFATEYIPEAKDLKEYV